MITNKMRPIHPGEIPREEYLNPSGLSANELAIALGENTPKINDIVREKQGITPNTTLRITRYFGGDTPIWLNLQTAV